MKADSVSRREIVKAGVGSLGVMALGARGISAKSNGRSGGKMAHETVRIAVVQQNSIPGQAENNRTKALALAEEALKNNADIVLFHEELLVGYVENMRELAEEVDGPTTRAFQSLLAGSESLILWGLTERENDKY